jgi:hypothetical protein
MCPPNLSKMWSPDTPSSTAIAPPNSSPQTTTPAKTDADVARSAEDERARLNLQRQGFVALTKSGAMGDEDEKPVRRVTLRA